MFFILITLKHIIIHYAQTRSQSKFTQKYLRYTPRHGPNTCLGYVIYFRGFLTHSPLRLQIVSTWMLNDHAVIWDSQLVPRVTSTAKWQRTFWGAPDRDGQSQVTFWNLDVSSQSHLFFSFSLYLFHSFVDYLVCKLISAASPSLWRIRAEFHIFAKRWNYANSQRVYVRRIECAGVHDPLGVWSEDFFSWCPANLVMCLYSSWIFLWACEKLSFLRFLK